MELLFVTIGAFGIGLGARYALPGRDTYGVALLPAIAAAFSAIVWVGLTWLGWKFDGGWIWAVSLTAAAAISLALALTLPRTRRGNDENLLQKLSRA